MIGPALPLLLTLAAEIAGASPAPDNAAEVAVESHAHLDPGEGLRLSTADGRFGLRAHARLQPRFELGEDYGPADVLFQLRRARLKFYGNVFGRHNKFYIQLGFSPLDMEGGILAEGGSPRRTPLRDARVELDRLRDATVWIGQMKVPYSRERVISDADLGMIDRSIVNAEFNLDRDIGVQVRSDDLGGHDGRLGYAAGVFMGEGRNALSAGDPGLLYVARASLRPFGSFADQLGGDLGRSRRPNLALGVAYAFHHRAKGTKSVHGFFFDDGGTTNFHHITADATLRWRGLALESAFMWRRGHRVAPAGSTDQTDQTDQTLDPARNGFGGFVQLGALFPVTPLEFVGRYAAVRPLLHGPTTVIYSDEIGAGLNYYIGGHDLKIQADYARTWSPLGVADSVRLQVQIAI